MIQAPEFLELLQQAIDDNKIKLPTLPEVALKVRDAAEDENSTARDIAEIVGTDAAISARLVQVANSPLYRPRTPIEDVQMAVTRLGVRLVRSLVTSLAMKQIFQPTSDALDSRLRAAWEESVNVAAICKVMAQTIPNLVNEQAMLAGLVHNIGTLPILAMADDMPDLIEQPDALDAIVEEIYPRVGSSILKAWGFADELAEVAEGHRDLTRDPGPEPDYADLVLVARLQLLPPEHPDAQVDWASIPAIAKVGLAEDVEVIEMEGVADVRDALL